MTKVTFQPMDCVIEVPEGTTILDAEKRAGISQDAPCGGLGKCGKCKVLVDHQEVLACQTRVDRDMVVMAVEKVENTRILTSGIEAEYRFHPVQEGKYLAAFDIGTTTLVCYLLDGRQGNPLAVESMLNPQYPFGADVISRIQKALAGEMDDLTDQIRKGASQLLHRACERAGASEQEVAVVTIVGNPCMQQLFLGISPENLSAPPFAAKIKHTDVEDAVKYLPECSSAKMLIIPDIAGYIGADTIGCLLSARIYEDDKITLMVDIGTNGEMILGNKTQMTACSTAAGPALEGARIACGMRGAEGAIDHIWEKDGKLVYSTIGGVEAVGICGSGLIDAVAVLLERKQINKRGRILYDYEEVDGERRICISDRVYLTQNDIREVQMAKGAIAAGIELMANHIGVSLENIEQVLLAGAFGSFIRPASACRIGMIPEVLLPKIRAIGNAAGSGSQMIVCSEEEFLRTNQLIEQIEPIELAALPTFQRVFAKNTSFTE